MRVRLLLISLGYLQVVRTSNLRFGRQVVHDHEGRGGNALGDAGPPLPPSQLIRSQTYQEKLELIRSHTYQE